MDTLPASKPEIDITVLMTCYNEERFICDALDTVTEALRESGPTYEVIVIDDVSKDNSVQLIRDYIKNHPHLPISLHVNEKNCGLANNFINGAFMGKGKYYRLCCGDNPEPKEALVHLFKNLGKADLIISYQRQDEIVGKKFFRKLASNIFTWSVNTIGGFNIKYYNGLPIYLRYHVMRWSPITLGFGFQADTTTRLLDEGVSYIQIPMMGLVERKGSSSTAFCMRNILSVVHTLLEVAFRRLRRTLYRKYMPIPVEIKINETE